MPFGPRSSFVSTTRTSTPPRPVAGLSRRFTAQHVAAAATVVAVAALPPSAMGSGNQLRPRRYPPSQSSSASASTRHNGGIVAMASKGGPGWRSPASSMPLLGPAPLQILAITETRPRAPRRARTPCFGQSAARGGQRHPWKFPRPAQGLPDAMAVIFPLSLIPRRKRLFYDRLPPGSRDAIARHPQPPIPESTGEIWGFSIAGIASSSWQSAVVLVGRVALVVAAMRESQRRPGGARGHRKRTESKRHSSIVNADPTSCTAS
ncbi:hypothetical protein B2J93_78 [Marssonina coronariae]|uniref:Uncharacterized protein n=1 Tax=Diplocarpon coronariae TaxID=2795749 RepID=A0A218Z568_9HELO|nr:hypothetical protein B2J93_78 [Marssonina coronariae]